MNSEIGIKKKDDRQRKKYAHGITFRCLSSFYIIVRQ